MFVRLLTVVCLLFAGCEKTDHDSIDKWVETEQGPAKLQKAVANEGIDPDLSAHAAVNLVRMGKADVVRAALEHMSQGRRTDVVDKMVPRLWDVARVEDEKRPANNFQIAAKDALVDIRQYTDDAHRKQIDGYLIDWYAVYAYEARARGGHHSGPEVARMVGSAMTKKMIDVVNGFLAAPGQEKSKFRITDELMLGIAATGGAKGVEKLLEIARMDRGDPSLRGRAIDALYKAYVDNNGLFEVQTPEGLAANLDGLVELVKDPATSGNAIDDLIKLIRAVGAPKCIEPLVSMIGTPHQTHFKYVAAGQALRCGGVKAILEVVRALPAGAYDRKTLDRDVVKEITKLAPRSQVLTALRELLADRSVVVRWVAIEALAGMKSVEDKARIAALERSREPLLGYWGQNPEGKKDPTLGQRAKELAAALETSK